jgi:putative nucleotidyltransferase with HDIG domain
MKIDSETYDESGNPIASLFASSSAGGLHSPQVNAEKSFVPRSNIDREVNLTTAELQKQIQMLSHQVAEANQELAGARSLNRRLLALNTYGKEIESIADPEKTALNMANLLFKLVACQLVCVFSYSEAEQQFRLLASSGPSAAQLPNNFQPDLNVPVIRQAVHSQHLACSREFGVKNLPLPVGNEVLPSLVAAPLIRYGLPRGLILMGDTAEQAFNAEDVTLTEAAAERLLQSWENAQQNETLTGFVQTVTMLSVVQEQGSLLEMVASIARRTLNASYTIAASLNQHDWILRESGRAPRLFQSLQNGGSYFLEQAKECPYTIHVRDLRNEGRAAGVQLDSLDLRTMLASPIRINGTATGVLLAFGKNGENEFTETDIFLAELLASQAAVNLESCYLNQELRSNLKTTQLLYDLSISVAQADSLTDAARAIARTAYRLTQAQKCGLLLFSPDGRTEAQVLFPADDPTLTHPYHLIQQAMNSRQQIYTAEDEENSIVVMPIQTMRRCYGALWVESSENPNEPISNDEIRIVVNQAAVALERSILLEETRYQASELVGAMKSLERSYDDLLVGLTRALDARDRETEDHSIRVQNLAVSLGLDLGLSKTELKALKHGALLHDIGKIGVKDGILLKRGPLDDSEWQEMRQHPQIGAQIIQAIPYLHDALPVIAFHQERWDGSGYPARLRGKEIPLVARLFAVIDVYDALTSDRPYRKALSTDEAFEYLENQAGVHFDPEIVSRFIHMVRGNSATAEAENKPGE